MSAFTRLGAAIWDWEPFTELGMAARVLWLALYTSAEAKRHVPGLWQGGIAAMADAARMQPDDVRGALDQLLERGMVEYDPKFRVLRLCELPDPGEWPSNGRVIKGWWTKFNTVPQCPVRDAHVRTLHWICTEGAKNIRRTSKEQSPDHVAAWGETFAMVQIPEPRRRGLRRLSDDLDNSTRVQPSLFSPPSRASGSDSVGESSYPQVPAQAVDNSAVLRQSNEIRGPERVSHTVSDTVSHTHRIPDPGSRIPEFLLSDSGRGGGGAPEQGRATVLTLVPPSTPYTASEVISTLATGPWDPSADKAYQEAVGALISGWAAEGWGVAEIALLAEYNRHSGRVWNARMLVGCDMRAEIDIARRALDWRDVRMATMQT